MIENAPINIMRADRNFIIRYMNAASRKTLATIAHLLPCKVEEVVGQCIDIFHKDPARVRRILSDPANLPHHAHIKLGTETLNLLASAIYDAQNNYMGTMVTWDVATEKLRLEALNKDYAAQVAVLNKNQAVVEFSPDTIIQSANENFLRLYGWDLAEIQGKPHAMIVDEVTRNSVQFKELWAKLSRGEYVAVESRRTDKSGREFWIQASYNPILDQNGKPLKIVAYVSDISEQKAALNGMLADAAMLTQAAAAGKLSTRADVNRHQGEFRTVVEGVKPPIDPRLKDVPTPAPEPHG